MRTDDITAPDLTKLTVGECWEQAREGGVGRLAVIRDEQPDIFPVNFVTDQGTVVFRTNRGSKRSASRGSVVAFEIDGTNADTQEAWSVVMTGPVVEVKDNEELIDLMGLHLLPWHDGEKSHHLRLIPQNVTGRRFTVRSGTSVL